MGVSFIVMFKAQSQKQDEFLKLMQRVKLELPKVDGCLGVDLRVGIDDDAKFILVEAWESQGHHETHVNNMVASGAWDNILTNLSEDPDGSYFQTL